MNVFDFDGTIYSGDSSIDFYLFCLRKNPKIIRVFGKQLKGVFKYKMGKISKNQYKSLFFSFLSHVEDVESLVGEFWKKNQCKIKKWYKEIKSKEDVIISASPEFLLSCMKEKLDIQDVIATKVDKKTGKLIGENCRGEEKVNRFKEKYDINEIEGFYSDSKADTPMACISKQAYMVKKNTINRWDCGF